MNYDEAIRAIVEMQNAQEEKINILIEYMNLQSEESQRQAVAMEEMVIFMQELNERG